MIDIYFDVSKRAINYNIPYPFIHEADFKHRLRSSRPPKQVTTLTMCALVASCGSSPDGARWPYFGLATAEEAARSEEIFDAAMARIDFEEIGVEVVQALIVADWFCSVAGQSRFSQEWLLSGMAMRMALLLKLNVDPDILEAEDPYNRRWTWLQKETRRRVYSLLYVTKFCSASFHPQLPAPNLIWWNADPVTGEPPTDSAIIPNPHFDYSTGCLLAMNVASRIVAHNMASGVIYASTIKNPSTDPSTANPLTVPDASSSSTNPTTLPPTATSIPTATSAHDALKGATAEFTLLAADVRSLNASLDPDWSMSAIENTEVFSMYYDSPPRPRGTPMYWIVLVQLWLNASRILLHRPRVMRELARLVREVRENAGPGK
ncbi:hypothetical protein HK101_003237, partial [Irineochytrium annulatum]